MRTLTFVFLIEDPVMSYQVYKLMHFLGVFLLLSALAGVAFSVMVSDYSKHPGRRLAAMLHGIGLLLILIGGFGMLARLGIVGGLPGWIYAKLVLWLVLGASLFLVKRRPALAKLIWLASGLLAFSAGWIALYKPF
jgi:hypothetical protein